MHSTIATSPGRCLAVLLATCALLWTVWQLPGWYRLGSTDAAGLAMLVRLWQQPLLVALLLAAANAGVLYRATLPLALPDTPASLLDRPRYQADFVFWLCVVFHLGTLLFLLLFGAGWLHLNPLP
ncbi:hypothetical protein [Hymenobacter psychrophilus]|uniref:Uncharacterized protein n=1 Tax=Hymenobacter psychrophilus TaxID=651662 RepID=A0A1H3FHX4_9BACT|nr:hypothetical protein [Hymenobacter psychrophilus]SDX90652.1 hypothetical protein SAMN04488069_10487 [Hymenobacter psychrophilus]